MQWLQGARQRFDCHFSPDDDDDDDDRDDDGDGQGREEQGVEKSTFIAAVAALSKY